MIGNIRNTILLSLASLFAVSAVAAQEPQEKYYSEPNEHPSEVYFGDTHIHSSLSVDASLWGMNKSPADIYRYAKGEELTSFKGWQAKLIRPLDFTVIADHSDAYGFYNLIADGADFIVAEPQGARWHKMFKD